MRNRSLVVSLGLLFACAQPAGQILSARYWATTLKAFGS